MSKETRSTTRDFRPAKRRRPNQRGMRVGPGGEPHGAHRTAPAAPTALSNGRRRPHDRAEISPPLPIPSDDVGPSVPPIGM